MARGIHTIGHSTHSADDFGALLAGHGIEVVADVRRYPGSRRNPQFNAATLAESLAARGTALRAFGESLGGRRRTGPDSPNGGWRVEGFRGYADYMHSKDFAAGLGELEELARGSATALMCAEADWHRCHRRLISDALVVRGWRVLHIDSRGGLQEHELTPFAVVEQGTLTYPPVQGTLPAAPE